MPKKSNKVNEALDLLKKLVQERDTKPRVIDTDSSKHEYFCRVCDKIVKANEPQVILGKLVGKKQVFIWLHKQCATESRLDLI